MSSWSIIKETLRLEEVEEALGLEVNRVGNEDIASCPLPSHGGADVHPSFSINNRTYAWYCFACGVGGSLPRLLQELMGVSWDGALAELAKWSDAEAGLDSDRLVSRVESYMNRDMRDPMVRDTTLPWFPEHLIDRWWLRSKAKEPWTFLMKRGFTEDTIASFKLGYEVAYEHPGWGKSKALIIPHYFEREVVGWQARTLEDKRPKYVSSADFPKKDTLFAWDGVGRGDLVVVESAMTAMKLWQFGWQAVATFGASISDRQIELLSSHEGTLLLSFDNDDAGKGALEKLASTLQRYTSVDICPFVPGDKGDLGDLDEDHINMILGEAKPSFLALPGV